MIQRFAFRENIGIMSLNDMHPELAGEFQRFIRLPFKRIEYEGALKAIAWILLFLEIF